MISSASTAISNIRPGDWLFVADLFEESPGFHIEPTSDEDTEQRKQRAQLTLDRRSEYRDQRYYRILHAQIDERAGSVALQLERGLDGHTSYDLQAQV
jgi:hypothetical protein